MTDKIRRFLTDCRPDTPCLVVDLDVVARNYSDLERALPEAEIFYAVKANPAKEVLTTLLQMGAYFDSASIYEIETCLDIGASPDRIAFGNTIKKSRDIARAFAHGVRLFAFDSRAELAKISTNAPGASVFCRIYMGGVGADWPLSRKFGCEPSLATELLCQAVEDGLNPAGVSFHVGSQQRNLEQWDVAIARAAEVFSAVSARGIELELLNLGGGFPAHYRQNIEPVANYGKAIRASVFKHFGSHQPRIIVEPGRGIVGNAGILQTEIILVAEKSREPGRRWVFLDVGKFGGLPETFEEAIQYRITTPYDGGPAGPVVLAGPTCDEVDVLYDAAGYTLPLALSDGDKIELLSTGAYTATYASVCFNGFPPLSEYYI
ncbi:MAG: ornithine decarboxylase [Rhodospirillaceae bacterium]|nr:ornithine decarboxylase [Rhodospirillaceae bacterium]